MPDAARPVLSASYATASTGAVEAFAAAEYGLADGIACTLLSRGFNDIYELAVPGGERLILRLSGHRARGPADVAAETAFLAYLDAAGVPVSAALPTTGGALSTVAMLADGPHAAVLFPYIEGRRPDLDTPEDARLQGATLARLHDAADRYPGRTGGLYRLDLDHLLHRPVAAILGLGIATAEARSDLAGLEARLAAAVTRHATALTLTRCHGDCHGLNARIPTAGRHAGCAVFFDFDDGGYGYLAYDLAVHLWAQISFGRRRHAMWHAFQSGYAAIRPIAAPDEGAIPTFVAIRHLWLMGGFASKVPQWGTEALTAAWLEREVAFLLDWERQAMSPTLL